VFLVVHVDFSTAFLAVCFENGNGFFGLVHYFAGFEIFPEGFCEWVYGRHFPINITVIWIKEIVVQNFQKCQIKIEQSLFIILSEKEKFFF
jgi:hypothetical protein